MYIELAFYNVLGLALKVKALLFFVAVTLTDAGPPRVQDRRDDLSTGNVRPQLGSKNPPSQRKFLCFFLLNRT